ncbi:prepilin-type N-terminal cleavage/methylation domain-containing protein [Fictibacillus sp. KIGAM418]|uniref:ComG operon protein 3 n=1 Tax=Fictibacillus marinisediminis TaxID=2878389 RepID=A0A9X2BHM2_9BACL|nr:competence type IV pilus major pilin ComGC [Fictibacillus marinisediminis]MCK6257683.1 prepilin-type N-terminal cleavage/methylation domain-containing protein [Fictibacillus marinisediminis]
MKDMNEKGFTLIEMMIVLLIISVLLLIALPSMAKNLGVAKNLGCKATLDLVQGQVGAYEADKEEKLTDLDTLVAEGYVDTVKCPNGNVLELKGGTVVEAAD